MCLFNAEPEVLNDIITNLQSNKYANEHPESATNWSPVASFNMNNPMNNKKLNLRCQSCHITYRKMDPPLPVSLSKCNCCKKKYVPEILITTIEPPNELETVGKAVLLEAHVCRPRKYKVGENVSLPTN